MVGTQRQVDYELYRTVGAEVHRLRGERHWSLADLSTKTHYSVSYLSKIENGKKRVTPEMARSFDEVFDTGGMLTALLAIPQPRTPVEDEAELVDAGLCPYPGLVAFGPGEARWFFGREQITAELIARLDEHLGGGGPLAVVAPSGAGKSSLLAAGLIPALAGGALPGSGDWLVVNATPGAYPRATLAGVAERAGVDPAAAAKAAHNADEFAALLTEAAAVGTSGEKGGSTRIVLIVDQFEEVFTEYRDDTERHAFVAALSAAAQCGAALVVLGVRADFYGACLAYPALLTALQAPVALGPMNTAQLRQIITGPAAAEDLGVEPGLVELMLRDLGVTDDPGTEAASYDPGALPLLAHALRATWQFRSDRTLTVAGYLRTGGIRQALASTAERAYARLNPAEQRIVQQVLLRLINVGEHGSDTRHRLPRTRLIQALPAPAETIENVLEVLARARLVALGIDREDGVEITHEALLTAWPRLAGWISADRAGLRTHQQLTEAAEAWDQAGRDPSGLYRGTRLAIARTWATDPRHKDELSALETAYLDASIDQEHREQQAERRRNRRLRQLVTTLAALLVVALAASVLAAIAQHNAAHQRDMALSREVADEATKLGNSDVSLAMQLSLAAYRIAPTTEALSALLRASTLHAASRELGDASFLAAAISPDGRTLAVGSAAQAVRLYDITTRQAPTFLGILTDHTGAINTVAFSPDGHTLATGGSDNTIRIWDLTNAHHPGLMATLPGSGGWGIMTVAFSPDGHTLASGDSHSMVQLWNLTNPRHPTPEAKPIGLTGTVWTVAFSPDGHTLATGDDSRAVRLWDLSDIHHPTAAAALPGHTNSVTAVAFSPDGRTLASGSSDATVRLWDLTSAQHPSTMLTGHTTTVNGAVFSPDGRTLATGSYDHTVLLWDVTDPRSPIRKTSLTGHNGGVNAVAFTPDGHTLATASDDGTARLWNLSDPHTPTEATLNELTGPVYTGLLSRQPLYSVTFSPDGHTLATGSDDSTVRLWNLNDPQHPTPEAPLTGHSAMVFPLAFSPNGHTLASGSNDGTVRLWNLADAHHPSINLPHGSPVQALAFSPDGHILATGTQDGTVRLWDPNNPHPPTPLAVLPGHTSYVYAMAFSRDGHTLATGSYDNTVRLWDVTNPQHPTTMTTLTDLPSGVNAVAFSPDAHTLAIGYYDMTVALWDVTDHYHPTIATTLSGHNGGVRAVAFSPDGHTLASASIDNTARLWDVTDPPHAVLKAVLTGHTNAVEAVAFSPDGHILATASDDGTARLWDTHPDQAANDICPLIVTSITTTQWEQYIPDLPYNPPCNVGGR